MRADQNTDTHSSGDASDLGASTDFIEKDVNRCRILSC